ncbi:MAG TPA: hypothetical protein VGL28_07280 [Steroidobacteraceae bacterium]|jgi:hypothetical protein
MQRQLRLILVTGLAAMVTGLASAAGGSEALTGLPLPDASSGMRVDPPAVDIPPAPVCRSTMKSSFYSVAGFQTSTAIAWYGAHLKGFKHLHGYGAGRTQDAFLSADGMLYVGITGSPGKDGADSEAYAILYGTFKPAVSEKVLLGMLTQRGGC